MASFFYEQLDWCSVTFGAYFMIVPGPSILQLPLAVDGSTSTVGNKCPRHYLGLRFFHFPFHYKKKIIIVIISQEILRQNLLEFQIKGSDAFF